MRARRAARARSPGRRSAGAAGRGASGSRCFGSRRAGGAPAFARCPARRSPTSPRPAGRRATRVHRAALRRRAQHADRAKRAAPSSCASFATPWSEAPGPPTCCCRASASATSFPAPALAWLERNGATIRLAHRVERIERDGAGWRVDGAPCRPRRRRRERGRGGAPGRARTPPRGRRSAGALRYEPIATVYARSAGCTPARADARAARRRRRAAGAIRLRSRPARRRGRDCSPSSSAAPRLWVERGIAATEAATLAQANAELGRFLRAPLEIVRTIVEKRATFACTPGLVAAADGMSPRASSPAATTSTGRYPATLEGAVRSGVAAARAATGRSGENSGMKDPA